MKVEMITTEFSLILSQHHELHAITFSLMSQCRPISGRSSHG